MNRDIEARLKISAIDKTGKVLANVGNKLENLSVRAKAYNRVNDAVRDNLILLGKVAGPAAVGMELYRATKAAANFETSLFNIQKKSGATSDQMQKLAQDIRDLSKQMPLSREDIAAGMERGAAAGIPLDELKQFAKLTAMIADGWDVTAEEAGNFVAGFNKGLHIPMQQMEQFASLINDLADSGIADEKDIGDFIDRVGASLQNFGMSPNEVAAYGAAMLNLKMPAEVAARAMDTLTGKLLAPENLSKKSRTALEAVVGDLTKFSKLSGNEKMNRFMASLQKMTNQRRASLLGALLGDGFDDEIMRLVAGFDEVQRNLDMARKQAISPSHSITTLYEKQLATFNKQLDMFKNKLGDIELSLGNRILPMANQALTSISKALDDSDAANRGQEMMGWSKDRAGYWQKADDFIQKFRDAGISDDVHEADYAWTRALTAIGNNTAKSPDEYLQQEINKALKDAGGDLSGGPRRRFSKGYMPRDWLQPSASKYSLDNPPVPERRPTPMEMKDFNLGIDYKAMGERVSAASRAAAKRVAEFWDNWGTPVGDAAISSEPSMDDVRRFLRDQDYAAGRQDQFAPPSKGQPFSLRKSMSMDLNYGGSLFGKKPDVAKQGLLGSLFYSPEQDKQASQAAQALDEGSQKIKDGGDEAGKALIAAAQEAGRILQNAITAASAALANIKVNVNAVTSGAPQKDVNANLGRTDTFTRPATLGQ